MCPLSSEQSIVQYVVNVVIQSVMKWALLLFLTSCFSSALPTNEAFADPIEIKKIVTTCDQDKDGELNSNEFTNCLKQSFPKVRNLDINGDGRVEKHEIKQMVQLTSPTRERDRAAYLAEIGKFKEMIKDCDQDRLPNSGGRSGDNEIGVDEGIECLKKYVSFRKKNLNRKINVLYFQPHHKEVFEECDENKDGRLVREEFKNHITRVRQRMNVNYKPPESHTTPMN